MEETEVKCISISNSPQRSGSPSTRSIECHTRSRSDSSPSRLENNEQSSHTPGSVQTCEANTERSADSWLGVNTCSAKNTADPSTSLSIFEPLGPSNSKPLSVQTNICKNANKTASEQKTSLSTTKKSSEVKQQQSTENSDSSSRQTKQIKRKQEVEQNQYIISLEKQFQEQGKTISLLLKNLDRIESQNTRQLEQPSPSESNQNTDRRREPSHDRLRQLELDIRIRPLEHQKVQNMCIFTALTSALCIQNWTTRAQAVQHRNPYLGTPLVYANPYQMSHGGFQPTYPKYYSHPYEHVFAGYAQNTSQMLHPHPVYGLIPQGLPVPIQHNQMYPSISLDTYTHNNMPPPYNGSQYQIPNPSHGIPQVNMIPSTPQVPVPPNTQMGNEPSVHHDLLSGNRHPEPLVH